MKIGKLVQDGTISIKTGPFGTQLKSAEYREAGTPVLEPGQTNHSESGDINQLSVK